MVTKRIQFDQKDCSLNPGEMIQHSGVYEICHEDEGRDTVILLRDTVFPFCRQCGENVRYKLVQRVPHISEDEDFRENAGDNPESRSGTQTSRQAVQLGRAHGFRFNNHKDNLQTWGSGPESGDL